MGDQMWATELLGIVTRLHESTCGHVAKIAQEEEFRGYDEEIRRMAFKIAKVFVVVQCNTQVEVSGVIPRVVVCDGRFNISFNDESGCVIRLQFTHPFEKVAVLISPGSQITAIVQGDDEAEESLYKISCFENRDTAVAYAERCCCDLICS